MRALCTWILVALLGSAGCGSEESTCPMPSGHRLGSQLERLVRLDGLGAIALSDLAPFAWDRVFFFGEYAPGEEVRRLTHRNYDFGLLDHVPEGSAMMVFTSGDRAACTEWFAARSLFASGWAFRSATLRTGLSRADAVFLASFRLYDEGGYYEQGYPYIELRQKDEPRIPPTKTAEPCTPQWGIVVSPGSGMLSKVQLVPDDLGEELCWFDRAKSRVFVLDAPLPPGSAVSDALVAKEIAMHPMGPAAELE